MGWWSQLYAFWGKQLIAHFLLEAPAPPCSLPETTTLCEPQYKEKKEKCKHGEGEAVLTKHRMNNTAAAGAFVFKKTIRFNEGRVS